MKLLLVLLALCALVPAGHAGTIDDLRSRLKTKATRGEALESILKGAGDSSLVQDLQTLLQSGKLGRRNCKRAIQCIRRLTESPSDMAQALFDSIDPSAPSVIVVTEFVLLGEEARAIVEEAVNAEPDSVDFSRVLALGEALPELIPPMNALAFQLLRTGLVSEDFGAVGDALNHFGNRIERIHKLDPRLAELALNEPEYALCRQELVHLLENDSFMPTESDPHAHDIYTDIAQLYAEHFALSDSEKEAAKTRYRKIRHLLEADYQSGRSGVNEVIWMDVLNLTRDLPARGPNPESSNRQRLRHIPYFFNLDPDVFAETRLFFGQVSLAAQSLAQIEDRLDQRDAATELLSLVPRRFAVALAELAHREYPSIIPALQNNSDCIKMLGLLNASPDRGN